MITLLGVFSERDSVVKAINELRESGFDPKDISIVMRDGKDAKRISKDTGAEIAGGTVTGATTGAILGGVVGFLAATVIPGLGALFIGGPLAAALGLTGAAASTVSGAATGALAGGLLGALMGFGLSERDAKHYESRVKEGAILIAVPVNHDNEMQATTILRNNSATDIQTFTQAETTEQAKVVQMPVKNEPIHEDATISSDTSHDDIEEKPHDVTEQYEHTSFTQSGIKGGASEKKKIHFDIDQMKDYLLEVDYPCSREDLIRVAVMDGADNATIKRLTLLPDQQFYGPKKLKEELEHMF